MSRAPDFRREGGAASTLQEKSWSAGRSADRVAKSCEIPRGLRTGGAKSCDRQLKESDCETQFFKSCSRSCPKSWHPAFWTTMYNFLHNFPKVGLAFETSGAACPTGRPPNATLEPLRRPRRIILSLLGLPCRRRPAVTVFLNVFHIFHFFLHIFHIFHVFHVSHFPVVLLCFPTFPFYFSDVFLFVRMFYRPFFICALFVFFQFFIFHRCHVFIRFFHVSHFFCSFYFIYHVLFFFFSHAPTQGRRAR